MKLGFYDYDTAAVGTDGVIFKDTLKGGATPTGVADVGTPTWGADGMTSGVADGAGFATTTTANTHLDVEGTLRFMVSKEALSCEIADIQAISGNWVGIGNPAFVLSRTGNASPSRGTHGHNRPFRGANMVGRLTAGTQHRFFGSALGWDMTNNQVEVVITWDGGGVDIYVDKFKAISTPWTIDVPTMSDNLFLGSIGSGGLELTFSEVLIATKKVILPTTLGARIINIYGDSYPKQGQYMPHDASDIQAGAFDSPTENGTNTLTIDGVDPASFPGFYNGVTGTTANMDAGVFAMVQRELNKKGIFTQEIRSWVQGGSGIQAPGGGPGDSVPTRVTDSLAVFEPPDIAIVMCGYNDASLNSGAGPSDLGAYETLYTDMIDELIAANSDIQIIVTNCPHNTNASFVPTETAVTNVNGVVDNVVAAYSNVKMADVFTPFGGLTADGIAYFQSDFIHPNTAGQAIYGRKIAEQIVSAY